MSTPTSRPGPDGSRCDDTDVLVDRAVEGDQKAFEDLFLRYRDRLKRMVHLRGDRRVQGRVDASDVLREARVEASQRLSEYAADRRWSFFLWLRKVTGTKLSEVERRYLGEQAPKVAETVALHRGALPEANSVSLAAQLLGTMSTPSEAAIKIETRIHVQDALNDMDPIDREIVALTHFERLSTSEIADVLQLSRGEAGKRYLGAIKRLRSALSRIPGFRGL